MKTEELARVKTSGRQGRDHGDYEQGVKPSRDGDLPRRSVETLRDRFDRTEPLEILLFQQDIKHSIGEDVGFGIRYRPKLNENWVVTAGEATLFPGAGLNNLYNSKVLLSGFASLALTF